MSRLKNAAFWISLVSFIPVLLEAFGVTVVPETWGVVKEFLLGGISVLVVLGILNNPTTQNAFYRDDKTKGEES